MKNVLAKNTTILSVAGFVSKVFSALYKFPIIIILGQEGLGMYSIIYSVFAIFLILGTSSFPVGISRYISTHSNNKNAMADCLSFCTIISVIFCILLFIIAKPISQMQGKPEYIIIYFSIAPMIVITFIMGTFRGYFQGIENMMVVAKSQIIEQLLKIFFGLSFCIIMFSQNIIKGVLGLFLGIGISELITTMWLYRSYKKISVNKVNFFAKKDFKGILHFALPVCISSSILPLSQSLTSIILLPALSYFSVTFATKVFGFMNGIVASIINIPLILTSSLSISLIPNISRKLCNSNGCDKDIYKCIKNVFMFSGLFMLLFFLYAEEISTFLIQIMKFDINAKIFANFFRFSAITIFYSAFLQVFNSILQSIGKWYKSAIYLLIGLIVKISLLVLLTRVQEINMYGVLIAEDFATALIVIMQCVYLKKELALEPQKKDFIKSATIFTSVILCTMVLQNVLNLSISTSIIKFIIVLALLITEFIILNVFNIDKLSKINIFRKI